MRPNPELETRNAKRPFVLLNMSMTADGKIATTNRSVSSFSSPRDQTHLLELRATADAVMCGARTVDLNAITLGPGGRQFRRLRRQRGLAEYSLRIIVSGSGSLNPNAAIFSLPMKPLTPALSPSEGEREMADRLQGFKARILVPGNLPPADGERARARGTRTTSHPNSPIIILTTAKATARKLKRLRAVADEVKVFGKTKLNLRGALRWLRKQHRVKRLVCEGGGELNEALFRAGLVDELHLTLCPRIIGGGHAPTIADGVGFRKLARAAPLQLHSARRVGDELFLVYRTCKSRN